MADGNGVGVVRPDRLAHSLAPLPVYCADCAGCADCVAQPSSRRGRHGPEPMPALHLATRRGLRYDLAQSQAAPGKSERSPSDALRSADSRDERNPGLATTIRAAAAVFAGAGTTILTRPGDCKTTAHMRNERLGNYRVVSRIGEGGMGTVYRAEHALLDRAVAIKVLQPELSQPCATNTLPAVQS